MDTGWKGRLGRKEGSVEESSWVSGLHSRSRQFERIRSVGGKSMSLALNLLSMKPMRGEESGRIPQGEVAQRLCLES